MSKPRKNESWESWFGRQGIFNFTAAEVASYFTVKRRGVRNSAPPRYMWQRIVSALHMADDMREHFGKPCTINSSYRSEKYNRGCGGAKFSQHKEFRALDLSVKGVSPKRVADYFYKRRRAGDFKGGIGRYRTFTHIDTRGYNASWGRN